MTDYRIQTKKRGQQLSAVPLFLPAAIAAEEERRPGRRPEHRLGHHDLRHREHHHRPEHRRRRGRRHRHRPDSEHPEVH